MQKNKCYLCNQSCFVYLTIIWCNNIKCNNYCQSDSDKPHPVVTFLGSVEKGEILN